jgi:hypothetical protein
MSPEFLEVIFPLTFLGVCCLVGQIVVLGHRERSAAAPWPRPVRRSARRETRKKLEVGRT